MPDEMIDELALKHSESSSAKLYSCLLQDLEYNRKKYKTLSKKKGIHKTWKRRSLLADVNTLSIKKQLQGSKKLYLLGRWQKIKEASAHRLLKRDHSKVQQQLRESKARCGSLYGLLKR